MNERALTVRLPADLHDALRERAAQEERTIAGIMRLAARRYIEHVDQGERGEDG
jgi:predicted DNA-binding protein